MSAVEVLMLSSLVVLTLSLPSILAFLCKYSMSVWYTTSYILFIMLAVCPSVLLTLLIKWEEVCVWLVEVLIVFLARPETC